MRTLLGGEDWGNHITAFRSSCPFFGRSGGQCLKDAGDRLLVFRGGCWLLGRSFVGVGAVGVKMFVDGV